MAKSETWYDRQAFASKLITYAALLVLLGSIGWAGYSAWLSHKADQPVEAAKASGAITTMQANMSESADYHAAMFSVLGGITAAAMLLGVSAVIDLQIVQCEALRNRR